MKTAYWFDPTFFIANNVESRRYTWQNKHLFENPWVGAHSVRTENHCLSMQSVRVWFAVLTIGGASPRAKDFHSNTHLSCVPMAFGPKSTISQNRQLKTLVMLIRDFSKDIQSFLNSKVANIPSHESIGIDLGIKIWRYVLMVTNIRTVIKVKLLKN